MRAGERVAIFLEPSLPFYLALFGAMKAGAVAVPMFTLLGRDAVAARIDDCRPVLALARAPLEGARTIVADDAFLDSLAREPDGFETRTESRDMAMYQYTSGTTRALPEAVRHRHRAIVTVLIAALYATGVRPGDRFCCPSSPAWGHGLWHGTLGPPRPRGGDHRVVGAFRPGTDARGAGEPPHHQRLRRRDPLPDDEELRGGRRPSLRGREALVHRRADRLRHREFVERTFGRPVRSMYGTTEVGVILGGYPGAADLPMRPGSLGKPMPGVEVAIRDAGGAVSTAGASGEIVVRRDGEWFPTRDLGRADEDGYFYHAGRADDVIISAGWTMSAVEIEDALLRHPDVSEIAVIGVPDALRGQVVKAFVVSGARAGRRRLRGRASGVRARAPRPARVSAAGRVRARAAQDAGRQGQPQGAEGTRGGPCRRRGPGAGRGRSARLPVRRAGRAGRGIARGGGWPRMTADAGGGRFPRITEEGLDALRRRIGVRIQDSLEPGATRRPATTSAITRTASATTIHSGATPAYARATRYGDVIAPPSFLFACSRIVSGYVGGLPGIHAMWAGADWRWHRVAPRNTEIHTEAWLKDLVLHETRFAGRAVQQIYHVDFFDGDGNLLCGADSWCFRTERDTARERGAKYDEVRRRGERRYRPEELDEVFRRTPGSGRGGRTPAGSRTCRSASAFPRC